MRYPIAPICLLCLCAASSAQTGPIAGTTERIKVHGQSLEGNLEGDSPDRDVSIYLPPSYKTADNRRYPVVYFLHGYTDSDDRWFGLVKSFVNLPAGVDKSLTQGAREMIVVMPNAYTRYAGSMYSSSVVTGDWEAYITRTWSATSTAITGPCPTRLARTGGTLDGRLRNHADRYEISGRVLQHLCAQPCCMIPNMAPAAGPSKAEVIHTIEEFNKADFGTKAQLASAAVWSPNPKNPPFFFDLPTKDGQAQPLVLAKWAANAPLAMVDQYIGNLKKLKAIAFDAGDKDTGIAETIRTLDGILNGYDLPHMFEIYEGTHVSGIQDRIETKTMQFFSKSLAFEPARH